MSSFSHFNFLYFSSLFLLSQFLIFMVTPSVCVRSPSKNAKKTRTAFLQSVLPVTVGLTFRTGYPSGGSLRTVPPPLSRTCHHPHSSWSHRCTPRWLPACSLRIRPAALTPPGRTHRRSLTDRITSFSKKRPPRNIRRGRGKVMLLLSCPAASRATSVCD